MLDEQSLIKSVRDCPAREAATYQARMFLANQGWLISDRNEFDVIAVHLNGSRVIIKFWMRSDNKAVPFFYMKRFDTLVQGFVKDNNIKENVHVFLISNAILDAEASRYYRDHGRFTMKFCTVFPSDKEHQSSEDMARKKNVQTHLLRYVTA